MLSSTYKIFILFFIFITLCSVAYSGSSNESLVAIVPDKDTCIGYDGYALPLPDMDSDAASIKFINSEIDRLFGSKCKLDGLLLKGEITEKTLPQVRFGVNLLEVRSSGRLIDNRGLLYLDSPGGLISEAMKIGDLIAEKEMGANVVLDGVCNSACVFVYAAAKTRSGMGDIGIHRPFASEISATSLSYSEYLKKYDALTPSLKNFFSKYGVSPALVDDMNIIPSDNIRILKDDELDSYGLGFYNVAAKEHDKAKTIQICGQEFYDMDRAFYSLIESCRNRFGITVLDEKDEECWALARQAYPSYREKFDECKEKKAHQ